MTIFIASLFLPKTIQTKSSRARRQSCRRSNPEPLEIVRHLGRPPLERSQPSLFNPYPIALRPETLDDSDHILANEDGSQISFPVEHAVSDDKHWHWTDVEIQPGFSKSPSGRSGDGLSTASHDAANLIHDNFSLVNAVQGNARLTSAALAVVREDPTCELHWVGTPGIPTDSLAADLKREIQDTLQTKHKMLAVFCSDEDLDGHAHFCKRILWPVFHYQVPDGPKSKAYEDHSWKFYASVNEKFADKIAASWKPGDAVWIHDYHLLLVPDLLRHRLHDRGLQDPKIGLFLHQAFPSSEVFRCLPVRRRLLEGMLGAKLIGFQIREYSRHFLQTCSRILGAEAGLNGLQLEDRSVDVIHLPIGVDPELLDRYRTHPEVARCLNLLRQRHSGLKVIVGRDKLDHMRGVRQKLLSYELFLKKNPEWRGRVILIQVALATQEENNRDATVSDIVTRINSTWGSLAYQPVIFLRQDIEYPHYLALLTIADALLLLPQREGMNLCSHDYILCQDGRHFSDKQHGSLIISEFTGSASIFNGELSVNPWDFHQCANAIKQALEMSSDEKDHRWNQLYSIVTSNTGAHWASTFLNRLNVVQKEQSPLFSAA